MTILLLHVLKKDLGKEGSSRLECLLERQTDLFLYLPDL